ADCARLFFFFFQAEDGIRDRNVTGVQTCALPISVSFSGTPLPAPARRGAEEIFELRLLTAATMVTGTAMTRIARVATTVRRLRRSEERRVGKEWRAGRATGRQRKRAKGTRGGRRR